MREWYEEKVTLLRSFFIEYGKVTVFIILISSCLLYTIILVSLVTPKKVEVSFLDIGQGDAILIRTPSGHDMLIDGGPSAQTLEVVSSRLGYFDTHIDVVVATHPDADHITGLIPILEKYQVSNIVTSPIAGHTGVFEVLQKSIDNENAVVRVAKKGDSIIFGDGVTAYILYPDAHFYGNEKETNDASISMVITYGNESVLLTGDLPSSHEGELLDEKLPRHVTIYKAGHHGSKYSSGDQLLSYIRPEYAVISAGKDNRYGHPNPEAVGRLQTYTKEILSTIEKGTITFLLDGETASIMTTK